MSLKPIELLASSYFLCLCLFLFLDIIPIRYLNILLLIRKQLYLKLGKEYFIKISKLIKEIQAVIVALAVKVKITGQIRHI